MSTEWGGGFTCKDLFILFWGLALLCEMDSCEEPSIKTRNHNYSETVQNTNTVLINERQRGKRVENGIELTALLQLAFDKFTSILLHTTYPAVCEEF